MKMLVEIDSEKQVVLPKVLLSDLVTEIERKTCLHEEAYRGGAIWEICRACDAKWADDEGGKPEFQWQECVKSVREILSGPRPEPVQQPAQPIPTGERLPTEADADCCGNVWAYDADFKKWILRSWEYTCRDPAKIYWLPTDLTRPPAPGGEQ